MKRFSSSTGAQSGRATKSMRMSVSRNTMTLGGGTLGRTSTAPMKDNRRLNEKPIQKLYLDKVNRVLMSLDYYDS